jgi:hypothetical protein
VVAAVPEARVAMLILTWLTIEQVATRYEEPTQTRLHQLIAHAGAAAQIGSFGHISRFTYAVLSAKVPVRTSPVYIGIDVACAAGKKLPICEVSAGHPLMPLAIPTHLTVLIPRGAGNKEIAATRPFKKVAQGVASTIKRIVDEMGWKVERAALDARAAPPATGNRLSEKLVRVRAAHGSWLLPHGSWPT